MEWRPTKRQVFWAIGIVIALLFIGVLFWWLWGVLAVYIQPKTPTDKKDLVNVFVIIAAGVVGTLTAIAAVGNLIVSRRNLQNAQANLQQQRDLDERHAQDDALQAHYTQIGELLTEHKLMEPKDTHVPVRLLARAQTLTLLERLGSESDRAKRKKGESIRFLYDAGLINKDNTIVVLVGANLRGVDLRDANLIGADLIRVNLIDADLSGANLSGADLIEANLRGAKLTNAVLRGANLTSADLIEADLRDAKLTNAVLFEADLIHADLCDARLSYADLRRADLSNAVLRGAFLRRVDLRGATVTEKQLFSCKYLDRAKMPNGQNYEDWLKSKGSGEDGENSGSS